MTKNVSRRIPEGWAIVRNESEALVVWDADVREVVAEAPGLYWSIGKSKALRERGTGHRCYYLRPTGWIAQ